jgi:hypothetical protein
VIFALRQPAVLLGLIIGFVIGIAAVAEVQRAFVSRRLVLVPRRGPRRLGGPARRRSRPQLGSLLDPYGAAGAVVAGVGWGPRPPAPTGRRQPGPGPLLVALAVHGAFAAVGVAGYLAVGGSRSLLHGSFGGPAIQLTDAVHGSPVLSGQSAAAQILLGFAMVNLGSGLLRLVPIPPLEMGVLLWSRLPKSAGSRRLAYHLLEEAWGVAVLLVLLLIPLAGQQPPLLALLSALADPLLRLA